jgi:hypothetical protein
MENHMQSPQPIAVREGASQELLAIWLQELELLRREHAMAARFYEKLHWRIGLPSVALAAVLGASIWSMNLTWPPGIDPKVVSGILSIVVLIVNAAHTFLSADERSSRHKVAFDKFDALYREGQSRYRRVGTEPEFESFLEKTSEDAPTMRASVLRALLGESNTLKSSHE